jgi:NADPH-dependent 2,4-dienoyl-CoA reductase/sulfur reductase-like enzyme
LTRYDIAIIGAGPAGMAAAVEARRLGLSAIVVDEQRSPGGQIWRDVERATEADCSRLGPDYARGKNLAAAFRASGAVYRPRCLVWHVDAPGRLLNASGPGGTFTIDARNIIVATGALERAMPVPGWHLPGVMTAGGLQILLKTSGLVSDRAVLTGNGPLLWLIASQMVAAGVPPKALVEVATPGSIRRSLWKLPGAMRDLKQLRKGLAMIQAVRRAGVAIYRNAGKVEVTGTGIASGLKFVCSKQTIQIATDCIAIHHGILPNPQVPRLLGCRHAWDEAQAAFRPEIDEYGETSVSGIFVAGDGAKTGGAVAAEITGSIAARRIAQLLGHDAYPRQLRSTLAAALAIRPFLDTLYPPSAQCDVPLDNTIICRCEEVTAGDIRAAIAIGAKGPNQAKAYLRCGMGPCQGRVCGTTVSRLIASELNINEEKVGYYTVRPPIKPLPLRALLTTSYPITDEKP